MARKKPLVEDARKGLDALRSQLFEDMRNGSAGSYRDQFRSLARKRVTVMTGAQDGKQPDPKSDPSR